MLFIIP